MMRLLSARSSCQFKRNSLAMALRRWKIINAIQIAATLLKFKVLIQRECNARLHEFRRCCTNFC